MQHIYKDDLFIVLLCKDFPLTRQTKLHLLPLSLYVFDTVYVRIYVYVYPV